MFTAVRLYSTEAGELVGYNHPDARALAYGEGDEVEADDRAAALELQPVEVEAPKPADDHTTKAEAAPAPKRRAPRKRAAAKTVTQ